jgi:hypothetical protein
MLCGKCKHTNMADSLDLQFVDDPVAVLHAADAGAPEADGRGVWQAGDGAQHVLLDERQALVQALRVKRHHVHRHLAATANATAVLEDTGGRGEIRSIDVDTGAEQGGERGSRGKTREHMRREGEQSKARRGRRTEKEGIAEHRGRDGRGAERGEGRRREGKWGAQEQRWGTQEQGWERRGEGVEKR